MLDFKYRPQISLIPIQSAVEGDSYTLLCAAHSKPPATFSWYRKGALIHEVSGTSSDNQGPYTINPVNRSHTGIYTCKADNNVWNKDEQDVTFTVQYPPDITVVVQNTSIMTNISRLICNASGVPSTYTFSSTWSQDWPGHGKIKDWIGNNDTLTLNQLTYAHSGLYSCSATNGIKVFGTDQQYMRGSGYLLVKGKPQPPYDVVIEEINDHSAVISWKHGFHGGFPQTFVIQTSFDGNSWKNATTVEGEMLMTVLRINATVTGLEPATQYFVRMFSFNSKGAKSTGQVLYEASAVSAINNGGSIFIGRFGTVPLRPPMVCRPEVINFRPGDSKPPLHFLICQVSVASP
ncbi:nephrin-like [Dreissena polymorpha]|uniref:nephrin-like n=1 Tax=Dreissena polymorpha TaxID=45954 RepID=UPI0022644009|nr:nephrin-like [Dreissena polymorpha]